MQGCHFIIFSFIFLTSAEAEIDFNPNLDFEQLQNEFENAEEACKQSFGNDAAENLKEARGKLYYEFEHFRGALTNQPCNEFIRLEDKLQKTMSVCAFRSSSPDFQQLNNYFDSLKKGCQKYTSTIQSQEVTDSNTETATKTSRNTKTIKKPNNNTKTTNKPNNNTKTTNKPNNNTKTTNKPNNNTKTTNKPNNNTKNSSENAAPSFKVVAVTLLGHCLIALLSTLY